LEAFAASWMYSSCEENTYEQGNLSDYRASQFCAGRHGVVRVVHGCRGRGMSARICLGRAFRMHALRRGRISFTTTTASYLPFETVPTRHHEDGRWLPIGTTVSATSGYPWATLPTSSGYPWAGATQPHWPATENQVRTKGELRGAPSFLAQAVVVTATKSNFKKDESRECVG